ncbi:cytochrome b/b6 domain-containing protein [Shewanella sp. Isolate13]|uniref:cytochrome b/b6 domain-containing protein n=1 Tax=Shewanella sp. Isolate13 TaxID=2908531 RepID=UPI001EFD2C0B|nr:cytochrome b/b6 domain-containing protein [Shewanella sp. Isolate13]MCG9728701.1 cytochrome b/b6 domain-containing protein [Shewanella sp. Isolate13]
MAQSMFKRLARKYIDLQHVLIILICAYLIFTSGSIFIGRSLRTNASFWDQSHVYLGLIGAFLSITFLITTSLKGKWRQYFPWLIGDFSQLKTDILGFFKGKIPIAGGRGLFSVVEGIGMLLFLAVGLTGIGWFATQGSSDALMWRDYHIHLAQALIGFIVVHAISACLHLLDFFRN